MMLRRSAVATALIGLMLGLWGCASVSEKQLAKDVADLVRPGDLFDPAIMRLAKHGFICEPRGAGVACSRQRYADIVLSCLQRIAVVKTPGSNTVSGLSLGPTVCFGGFG